MRKMKDSGVEWIGKIPEDWDAPRMKTCISQRDGGAWGDEKQNNENDTICLRIADFNYSSFCFKDDVELTIRNYTPDIKKRLLLKKNDILIEKSGGGEKTPVGRAVIFDKEYEALFANFMDRIRVINEIEPKYFLYILATFYGNQYVWNYIKQTTGIQNLDMKSLFANEGMPKPSLEVQKRIAGYLDAKCSKIDAIIAKQETIIEKLKEYKLSVITEAVTKGLNPDVEMKDSGIGLFGNVPIHYEVRRLKFMCNKIADGTHFSPETTEDGYPYITAGDVCGKGIDYNSTKKISYESYLKLVKQGCRPEKNDVFIVKDGATTGRVGLMMDNKECVVLSSVAMLHPMEDVEAEYLMYIMMSQDMQSQITLSMAGSAMPRTTLTKLMNYYCVYAPKDEQVKIVEYLNNVTNAIDKRIENLYRIVNHLIEYKKSLIYEVVTGKKEV